jgi:prepilin-type N-terminal cleavage/methylation domain-containing protein
MRQPSLAGGFTLVEVMVALLLLSVAALGLSSTLVSTRKALARSGKRMRAAQLAADGMEQLRAGQVPGPPDGGGEFERSTATTPWNGHPGLQRVEVTVSWNDGELHALQLVTLARR